MATDPNSIFEDSNQQTGDNEDLNPNRSNDGNSGSPPTIPEIEPGKIPGVEPETYPAIEPEIEPGKIPDDSLIPHK
ncbi:MAG: hypothetical protein ACAH05_08215 [Methylophilus sp.]|nr:hypothetical protein [Methylophilus sp.]